MNDDDKNGYDHTELTAEERSALDALAREAVPPATLEDRVVAALASRGLVAPRRQWWIAVASLAAAVLIFLAGFALGARTITDESVPVAASPVDRQYVLFLYEGPEFQAAPLNDPSQVVREYSGWAEQIFDAGHFVGGERLALDGWVLGRSDAGLQVDRRLAVAPEGAVAGFFVIDAATDEEALAIAESHPHLRRGGHIAVRAVAPIF